MSLTKKLTSVFTAAVMAVAAIAMPMAQDAEAGFKFVKKDDALTTVQEEAPAQSIEIGETYDAQTLNALLKAEGHIQIANMDRMLVDENGGYFLSHIVTATPDLSKWYYVESNRDRSEFSVVEGGDEGLELNNIYTNDKRHLSSYKFERSKFEDEAKIFAKDYGTVSVGFYDDVIEDHEKNIGAHIALQGFTKDNQLISVLVNPDTKKMVVLETMGQGGVTGRIAFGHNYEFSPSAKAALGID